MFPAGVTMEWQYPHGRACQLAADQVTELGRRLGTSRPAGPAAIAARARN